MSKLGSLNSSHSPWKDLCSSRGWLSAPEKVPALLCGLCKGPTFSYVVCNVQINAWIAVVEQRRGLLSAQGRQAPLEQSHSWMPHMDTAHGVSPCVGPPEGAQGIFWIRCQYLHQNWGKVCHWENKVVLRCCILQGLLLFWSPRQRLTNRSKG